MNENDLLFGFKTICDLQRRLCEETQGRQAAEKENAELVATVEKLAKRLKEAATEPTSED